MRNGFLEARVSKRVLTFLSNKGSWQETKKLVDSIRFHRLVVRVDLAWWRAFEGRSTLRLRPPALGRGGIAVLGGWAVTVITLEAFRSDCATPFGICGTKATELLLFRS